MAELSCANCPFDIEQPNGKPFCIQDATCEISVNWLNEHERKIYNKAIEDFEKCFIQQSEESWCGMVIDTEGLQRIKEQLIK